MTLRAHRPSCAFTVPSRVLFLPPEMPRPAHGSSLKSLLPPEGPNSIPCLLAGSQGFVVNTNDKNYHGQHQAHRVDCVYCTRQCSKCFRSCILQTAPRDRHLYPDLVEKETEGQRGQVCLPLDPITSKKIKSPAGNPFSGWLLGLCVDPAFFAFPQHLAPLLEKHLLTSGLWYLADLRRPGRKPWFLAHFSHLLQHLTLCLGCTG